MASCSTLAKQTWNEADLKNSRDISAVLEKAKKEVLRDLPKVAREAKKNSGDGKSTPRHLEASSELLLECLSRGGQVATQLSNLQGMDLTAITVPGKNKVVPIGDSRALHCEITKGARQAIAALKRYRDGT
jgi:hypothetical protein